MTTLTRERRDRHVAALREAHRTGRPKATGAPVSGEKVCACVIIAETEGRPWASFISSIDLYRFVASLGYEEREVSPGLSTFPLPVFFNDELADDESMARYRTFDEVADMIAALDVIDEAEAITRQAADEMVGV